MMKEETGDHYTNNAEVEKRRFPMTPFNLFQLYGQVIGKPQGIHSAQSEKIFSDMNIYMQHQSESTFHFDSKPPTVDK